MSYEGVRGAYFWISVACRSRASASSSRYLILPISSIASSTIMITNDPDISMKSHGSSISDAWKIVTRQTKNQTNVTTKNQTPHRRQPFREAVRHRADRPRPSTQAARLPIDRLAVLREQ